MEWYTVDSDYLDYLRNREPRIPRTDYGENKVKPFFGELFSIGDISYVATVNHAQPRHAKLKSSIDFVKIYHNDKLICVVNLNYMFPVKKSMLSKIEYSCIESLRSFRTPKEKSQYIYFLKLEKKHLEEISCDAKAKRLYDYVKANPDTAITKRCFDFAMLESACSNYFYQK